MSRLQRILIGALAGSLLTLILHPASRRYILTPFLDIGSAEQLYISPWVPRNLGVLPVPNDTLNASLWTQAGAELLDSGKSLDSKRLAQLIEVCQASASGEPDNAYWRQMEAAFLWEARRQAEALAAWKQGALCGRWN